MTHETVAQFVRLRSLLMSVEDPAWLVHPNGKVLIKNEAAGDETAAPRWILDYLRGTSSELPIGARVRQVQVDGRIRLLAFGLPGPNSNRHELEALGLEDDALVETAEHLARGFSKEEIALLIGRPIGLVRMLVLRVHRLLGVTARPEIIDLVRRARSTAPPPRVRTTDVPASHATRGPLEPRHSAVFALRGVKHRRAKPR